MTFGQVFAQTVQLDTLRLMQYNLLNYRNTTGQCTNSTNNPDDKDGYMQTIVEYVKPDVILVNEMGSHWLNPNKMLTNALNKNGVSHYEQAQSSNNGFSNLVNMLFFNKNKLTLHKQDAIKKDLNGADLVRVIDVYTLYMNYPGGLAQGDTVFLTFFLAHLKAGSGSDDKQERADMTAAAMDYLKNNHQEHSYFFAGDFNIQTHSEACYQTLTKNSTATIRFYDPMGAAGSWNNNSTFSNLHTQSTHDGDSRGGCFSTGGMDDRFDFILCGKEVLDNTYDVHYIPGTYKALGQDSRRFNGNIKNPSSNIIPANVQNALYEMSDHLPVLMDVDINDRSVGIQNIPESIKLVVNYGKGHVDVFFQDAQSIEKVEILNVNGQRVKDEYITTSEQTISIDITNLVGGMYVITAIDKDGNIFTRKLPL